MLQEASGTFLPGTSRFGYVEVYGEAGVVNLHQARLRRRPAHALS
jgi:hypothetical protein